MSGDDRAPSVAEALQSWREAERRSIRATAQREAADVAAEAALLAEQAANSTAEAADAAQAAATQAARAAQATADAARKVLVATRTDSDAARLIETDALAEEAAARSAHHAARDLIAERHAQAGSSVAHSREDSPD